MNKKWLPTLVFGLSLGILGCSSSPSDPGGTGGATGGSSTGGSSTGGSSTGGSSTGGKATGGTATGGTATGGTATGGTATGGKAAGGAAGGSTGGAPLGGSTSTGGSGAGGAGPGSAPVPSKGCGKTDGATTIAAGGTAVPKGLATSKRLKISAGSSSGQYIIDIPENYDPTHPYRLIFAWHQAYGSAEGNANGLHPANDGPNFDAKNYAFFGLHREAMNANQPAIFIATQGIGNFPWDYDRDVVLFDNILALVTTNLCVDESRVFTTGFSFGAMMSYALSVGRASKLRGAVTMAAANYNFTQPTNMHTPIAYMGTTGMSDSTCPWGTDTMGGKACVLQHATDNGCTKPGTIQTAGVGSKKYLCYDFEGCKAGYPVKVCTFDGPHTPSSVDDGTSNGDDGLKAFIPPIAWKFISQL